jgi:hypothetical protein
LANEATTGIVRVVTQVARFRSRGREQAAALAANLGQELFLKDEIVGQPVEPSHADAAHGPVAHHCKGFRKAGAVVKLRCARDVAIRDHGNQLVVMSLGP